jgi:hypothetical protein
MWLNDAAESLQEWYVGLSDATDRALFRISEDEKANEMTRLHALSHYATELSSGKLSHGLQVFTPLMVTLVAIQRHESLVVTQPLWHRSLGAYLRQVRQFPLLQEKGLALPTLTEFWYGEFTSALKYAGVVHGCTTILNEENRKLSIRNAFATGILYLFSIAHVFYKTQPDAGQVKTEPAKTLHWIGGLADHTELR